MSSDERQEMSNKKQEECENRPGGCGVRLRNIAEVYSSFTAIIYRPVDPAGLAIVRILFGMMMIMDIPHERGLHDVEDRFADPMNCHFPLFDFIRPLPVHYMGLIYFVMWIGSLGMCIGYYFRLSCVMFVIPYWYLFLLEKSLWNNHSYLYGLVAVQFLCSSAHHSYSLDSVLDRRIRDEPVPVWNYWIIRFQFFLMYFYAGLKKFDTDWLSGNSMKLGSHWVFDPFRILLTEEQIDLWIVHRFGFLLDLTIGFFLLIEKSRPLAILFASSFHLMNSRLFSIGQFPYVCLATTPIFCAYNWPRKVLSLWNTTDASKISTMYTYTEESIGFKKKCVTAGLSLYLLLQLSLPYSHSLTSGYNNWTNGMYGYSWDMMVHSWDTQLITVTVEDHDTGRKHFIDPQAWVKNTRYSKHADMIVQYGACLKRNLQELAPGRLRNISIYLDVWCSLNKRILQRFVDPRQDILTAEWNPFTKTKWVFPLLSELTPWRTQLATLANEVQAWHHDSDSLFVADFPGLLKEHYFQSQLDNVTLNLLRGSLVVHNDTTTLKITAGESVKLASGTFHTVLTTSSEISTIMYTFVNSSRGCRGNERKQIGNQKRYDIFDGWELRRDHFCKSLQVLYKCL